MTEDQMRELDERLADKINGQVDQARAAFFVAVVLIAIAVIIGVAA